MLPLPVRGQQVLFLCVLAAAALAVVAFVDLSPRVDRNFFFSSDDSQLQEDERIREFFPERPQIIIAASGDIHSADYGQRVAKLSAGLVEIEGVLNVRDIHHGPEDIEDAFENELWRRLLVAEDGHSTNLVLTLETEDHETVIAAVEEVLDRHGDEGFELAVSGVPYVVEQIRRQVLRDLKVFGVGVVAVFSLVIFLLYRSGWIVLGTLVAAGTAASFTLLLRPLLGLEPDVLTPNITSIVFVVTLSQIVYLTANWKSAAREGSPGDPVSRAIRWTGRASIFGMLTALLGFLSLLLATAKPVRNFGLSCSVGTVLGLLAAYVIYPAYLASADPKQDVAPALDKSMSSFFRGRHDIAVFALIAAAVLLVPGLWRLNTDPGLFDYFSADTEVRAGLEGVDRAGGSNPLELVIRDAGGEELSDDDVFERMWQLQLALERDRDVGGVVSLPVLMAEAKDEAPFPFNYLLDYDDLLDEMEKPKFDRVAESFVTEDRRHGRFFLRMKESVRQESRTEVVRRLEGIVRRHGFVPVLTGGLYPLQGHLSELVRSSLWTGLIGLVLVFAVIAIVVTRSVGLAAAMTLSFSMIPIVLLGLAGALRTPLDIISVSAADVALGLAVDDMIHVTSHVRPKRGHRKKPYGWEAWVEARSELWRATVGGALIVSIGFALLLFSVFPPTRRLGFAVALGTIIALASVLLVFPRLAVAFADRE